MAKYLERPFSQKHVPSTDTLATTAAFTWAAPGTLEVDYFVDSENGYDKFIMYVGVGTGGSQVGSDSGSNKTGTLTYTKSAPGSQAFTFCYHKDGSGDAGLDTARVTAIRRKEGGVLVETVDLSVAALGALPAGWTGTWITNDGTITAAGFARIEMRLPKMDMRKRIARFTRYNTVPSTGGTSSGLPAVLIDVGGVAVDPATGKTAVLV